MGPDSLLRQKVKQKRFREGYEDGLSSTHKATSAVAFVMSEMPVEMLGQYSRWAALPPMASTLPGMLPSMPSRCARCAASLNSATHPDVSGRICQTGFSVPMNMCYNSAVQCLPINAVRRVGQSSKHPITYCRGAAVCESSLFRAADKGGFLVLR